MAPLEPSVGQNRVYTPYMALYYENFLPYIPYIHRIQMVLANPAHTLIRKQTTKLQASNGRFGITSPPSLSAATLGPYPSMGRIGDVLWQN